MSEVEKNISQQVAQMIAEMLGITIEQLKQEVIAQWQKELKYFEFKEDYESCIIIRDKIKLLQ